MKTLLENINNPADLKKLAATQLPQLAQEIRSFVLNSVSKTGGHLGSNLGTVELTLAMHYVFELNRDQLVWDVGHQCYTHKILTGRKNNFHKLRKAGGPSGFPNPKESDYDQFCVGHAGTSISTAIGLALGNQHLANDNKVIAFVGDASLVNGTNFEGLNNLGLVKRQLLIVLNDNSMAIDSTQGAVAKFFSKLRLSHTYEEVRRTTANILEHTPFIGKGVEGAIERIKKTIRMALPTSQLFESLNIPYFGPVDGHDVESLVKIFTMISQLDRPAILHVYSQKGKGFAIAEDHKHKLHSTGPFTVKDSDLEQTFSGKKSFTSVFGDALVEEAKKDEKIVAITSAMASGTGLDKFKQMFGDRFFDVGIAESAAIDMAAGMAKAGLKPVVCIYSTFLQRGFDYIFQEISLQNLPVTFCIDRAGLVGDDGPTHHGLMDIGFARMMPNIVVAACANEYETKAALHFATSCDQAVCIRYPRDCVSPELADLCNEPFVLGKSVIVSDCSKPSVIIVSYGSMLTEAFSAHEQLKADGLETGLINARFAAPLDPAIIDLIRQGKSIITVEDHRADCGFGSAILEAAAKIQPKYTGSIITLAVPKRFIAHDTRLNQFIDSKINADTIMAKVKQLLS